MTRQSVNNLLVLPKAKTEYNRRSFVISSCILWNNMSNEMRESTSLEIFKTKYLNEYFNWNILIIYCITLFSYWFHSFIIYCVNTVYMYNAGPHLVKWPMYHWFSILQDKFKLNIIYNNYVFYFNRMNSTFSYTN
jgi:hypothetical protein